MRKEVIVLALALVLTLSLVSANKAPIIRDLEQEQYICESSALSLKFNVADLDGDKITTDLSPNSPFYTRIISSKAPITEIELFSNNFTKFQSNQEYNTTLYVSDGEFVDTKKIKIKVFEINNPPEILPIPVATVDLNKTTKFQKTIYVTDKESKDDADFNYTISDPLNLLGLTIDKLGVINYTASENHIGIHDVEVCVIDNSVKNLQGKIGFCGEQDLTAKTCKKFQLAVTKANSPPTILVANSSNSSTKILDIEKLTFQISKYDPDGLYPDTFWYVDGKLKQTSSGQSADKFVYLFGCNIYGVHKIKAVVSDGLANDSIEWKFDVTKIPCENGILPLEEIGDAVCEEKWGCSNWNLCQNAKQSNEFGSLNPTDFDEIARKCNAKNWGGDNCGYQVRTCGDINSCNSVKTKPPELAPCYFSLQPSCTDKIQNCHDGSCEFLADCGGPCAACSTCSDKIKNQNEEGIDCGGPCAQQCIQRNETTNENRLIKQIFLFSIIICLVFAGVQILRIFHNKKILETKTKKGLVA